MVLRSLGCNFECCNVQQLIQLIRKLYITSPSTCSYWQVFEELEEIGKTIQEDVLDAGMPVHGSMGGDISKCPYYAAKMGAHSYISLQAFR